MVVNLLRKFYETVIFILIDFNYFFSFIIPIDKNLWVFGAWFGEKYADNSKYLFEYVNENHTEIRAVWLTQNHATLKLVLETKVMKHIWLTVLKDF